MRKNTYRCADCGATCVSLTLLNHHRTTACVKAKTDSKLNRALHQMEEKDQYHPPKEEDGEGGNVNSTTAQHQRVSPAASPRGEVLSLQGLVRAVSNLNQGVSLSPHLANLQRGGAATSGPSLEGPSHDTAAVQSPRLPIAGRRSDAQPPTAAGGRGSRYSNLLSKVKLNNNNNTWEQQPANNNEENGTGNITSTRRVGDPSGGASISTSVVRRVSGGGGGGGGAVTTTTSTTRRRTSRQKETDDGNNTHGGDDTHQAMEESEETTLQEYDVGNPSGAGVTRVRRVIRRQSKEESSNATATTTTSTTRRSSGAPTTTTIPSGASSSAASAGRRRRQSSDRHASSGDDSDESEANRTTKTATVRKSVMGPGRTTYSPLDGHDGNDSSVVTHTTTVTTTTSGARRRVRRVRRVGADGTVVEEEEVEEALGQEGEQEYGDKTSSSVARRRSGRRSGEENRTVVPMPSTPEGVGRNPRSKERHDDVDELDSNNHSTTAYEPSSPSTGGAGAHPRGRRRSQTRSEADSTASTAASTLRSTATTFDFTTASEAEGGLDTTTASVVGGRSSTLIRVHQTASDENNASRNNNNRRPPRSSSVSYQEDGTEGEEGKERISRSRSKKDDDHGDRLDPQDDNDVVQYSVDSVSTDGARRAGGRRRRSQSNDAPPSPPSTAKIDVPALTTFRSPSATTAHLSVIGDSVDEGNHDDDSSSALSYEDNTSTGGKGRRRSSRRSMQQDGSSGTSTVTVDSHENSHGSHMEHNTHNVESTLTTTTIVMSGGVAVESNGNEEEIGMQSFRRRKVAARRTGGRSSTTPQSSSLANTTTTEEATASAHNAVPSADNNDAPESVVIETDNGGVLGLIMDEPQGGPRNNNQNRRRSRKVSDVVSLVMANNHTVAAAAEAVEGATTAPPPPPPPPAAVESSTAANESSMVSAEVARGDEEGALGYSPNEPLANRVRRVMRRKSSTTTSSQPQQQAATEGDSTPPPPPPKALVEETNVTVPPVRQPTPPSVAPTLMSPKQQKLVEMNEDDGGILAIQLDEPQQKPRQQQQRRRSSAKDVAPTTTTAAVASPPVSQFADPVALAAAAPTAQAPPPPPQEKAPAPPPAPLHLSSSTTPSSPTPATTTGSGSGGANHSHNSSKSPRSSSSVVTLTGTPALNGVGGGGGAHDMPQFTNVAPMTSHPFHHVEVPRLIEEPKVPTPPKETKKSAGVEFATQTDPLETGPLPLAGYPHPPPYGHASHTHSHSSSGVAAAPSHSHSHSHSSSSSNSHHHGAAAAAGGGGAAFPSGTRSSLSLNGGERVGGGFTPSLQHIHGGGGGGGRQSRVVSIDESTGSNSIPEMHPSPPNSTTASLQRSDAGSGAVPGTLTRRRSLRNTVDFNSLPSIPQPTQGALLGSGERGMRVLLIIDRVIGAPLLSSGTRMFVYVGNDLDESGERGVSPSSPEFYKEARVYAVQQLNSSVADPEFGVELDVVLAARGTVVIVVIECIVKGERTTLGHSLIRLDSNLRAGNYKSRIFVGDPRQSRYQQLNGFKQDAVLDASNTKTRDALARVIRKDPHQLAYQPCGFVDWRCDSWDLSQPYYGIITEPPVTDYERVFLRERGAWRDYHRTPSNSYKILSNDELTKYMEDKTISYRTDELSAYIVPYNRSRGIFVNVECIRGIAKQKAVYKVIVTVRNGKRWFHGMTEHHDWDGDLGVQHFLDEPFMYTDLDFDPKAEMLFQVYRLEKPSLDNPGPVNLVGWSACSLFYADGFPRTGRFSIPIYDGPPPNFFLAGLKPHPKGKPHRNSQQQEPSLIRATGVREDDFYSPRAVISFTMGDAYRAEEFLPRPIQPYEGRYRLEDTLSVSTSAVAANRPPLQALYIPQTFFSQFPISKSAGILNIPLKDVLPTQLDGTTVDVDAIEEVMNHMLSQHVRRRAPPQ